MLADSTRKLLWVLLIFGLVVGTWSAMLDAQQFHTVFSEAGPFEKLSPFLWLVLAMWCLHPKHRLRAVDIALGVVATLAAAREADWDRAFTADSIFKISYYLRSTAPLSEKIPAAIITLAIFALLIACLAIGIRALLRNAGWRHAWMQTCVIGTGVLVLTKLLDRTINSMHAWFGIMIHGSAGQVIGGMEEAFECMMPLIFCYALMEYRSEQAARTRAVPAM